MFRFTCCVVTSQRSFVAYGLTLSSHSLTIGHFQFKQSLMLSPILPHLLESRTDRNKENRSSARGDNNSSTSSIESKRTVPRSPRMSPRSSPRVSKGQFLFDHPTQLSYCSFL